MASRVVALSIIVMLGAAAWAGSLTPEWTVVRAAPLDTHVGPEVRAGNIQCSELDANWRPLGGGQQDVDGRNVYTLDDGTLRVRVTLSDGQRLLAFEVLAPAWGGVDAVIVKGGPSPANVYRYDPPARSDTDLVAPQNPGGQTPAVSNFTICYDSTRTAPTATATPAPTDTPVPPTDTPTPVPTDTPVPPTDTPTPVPTETPTPVEDVATATPIDSPTPTPTVPLGPELVTETPTATGTPAPEGTTTPTGTPTTPTPTATLGLEQVTETPTATFGPEQATETPTATLGPEQATETPSATSTPDRAGTTTPTATPTPVAATPSPTDVVIGGCIPTATPDTIGRATPATPTRIPRPTGGDDDNDNHDDNRDDNDNRDDSAEQDSQVGETGPGAQETSDLTEIAPPVSTLRPGAGEVSPAVGATAVLLTPPDRSEVAEPQRPTIAGVPAPAQVPRTSDLPCQAGPGTVAGP